MFYIKSYFYYKFLIINSNTGYAKSFVDYVAEFKFDPLKRKSMGLLPIHLKARNNKELEIKRISNIILYIFYVLLAIAIVFL